MKNKIWHFFLLTASLLCVTFYACEHDEGTINVNGRLSRFFNASDADIILQKVVGLLEQKNDSTGFATEFIRTYGYPLWEDAVDFIEGECFAYAVPIKSLLPDSEINAIWFFVMNDSCTNYHVYSRDIADAITRQVGDETEQTWMFDYFTYYALHKKPTSGLKFEAIPTTKTTQVQMECVNIARQIDDYTIEVDVLCFKVGGGGNKGGVDLSGSGSVETPHPPTGGGGGGGGSGSGSGSSTGSSTAPTASKLFNSKLFESNWKALESRVKKIMIDCMGGALYNALTAAGKINIILTSDASSYSPATNTIKLNNKMESNELFHEMWHAYQFSKLTVSEYNNSTINIEIEAHYAQYLYLKKLKEYSNSKWEEKWSKNVRLWTITGLEEYVDYKGNLKPIVTNELLDFALNKVAGTFETKEYDDGKVYKYNWDIKGIDNFKNLRKLAKDC